jgi:ectoine hydroxylase-related dioxygenase (phytanoyl-CoA dioxygenase family)
MADRAGRRLNEKQVKQFHRDGFLIVDNLLDSEETSLLAKAARADAAMQGAAMDVRDTEGRKTNLSLWNHPGEDIYGMIARSERVVNAVEQLLGGEVYHYHSKLSAKQPKVGGAWEWHQDYGYWYQNGCLLPDMLSLYIAVDPATKENGCLQVLRGSHKMGRIEHGRFGEQTGADPERVAVAAERMELVYCELEAGSGVYFHCNTLHTSEANQSDKPRWGLICCYNAAHNDPYKEHHHPGYTPLIKVSDSAIRGIGATGTSEGRSFLKQEEDETSG